jgi:hypothetical protein
MVFDSLEPLSITSQPNPKTVTSKKVNMLDAPLARKLRVVVTKDNRVGVSTQQLVGLRESVIAQHTSNACPSVGDSELAKNGEKFSALLWRKPLGETPLWNCAASV